MKNTIVKELKKHIPQNTWDFLTAHKCMLVGGALTSILTKKDINDFDIYFKDRDSFVLSLMDIRGIKDKLDLGEYSEDLDINLQYLDSYEFHYLCHTEKSATFRHKHTKAVYQLIHQNFYNSVEEVFNDFDFTINMVGYDFELDEVVVHPEAMLHLSQRILATNSGTKYPLISVLRVNKYQDRGYTISKKEMVKLLLAVSKLEFNSYDDVGKHVGGLYGTLNVAKVFDTTKEFSIDEVIEQLSELDFDALNSVNTDVRSETFDDALEQIILGEHHHKLPHLKRVHLINGELRSDWDRSYTYSVGEIHYPKPKGSCDGLPFGFAGSEGIYCHKGIPNQYYGDTLLEVEPLNPKENTRNEAKFGYKEGVLVKQVLPFNTEEGYYTWLEEVKEIPSDVVKYLKLLKGH